MSQILGRVISIVVVIALLLDAAVDLFAPGMLQAEMTAVQFPPHQAFTLGIVIAACAALYAVPATAILGAILITGFLGGAICAHFRVEETLTAPQILSVVLGVAAWGGLYLRDVRLKELLPLRR